MDAQLPDGFCGVPLTCVPITSSALTTTVHNLANIHPVTKQPDVGIHSTLYEPTRGIPSLVNNASTMVQTTTPRIEYI